MMATLTREQLEKFVEERPHLQDNLRCRNILRDYENNQVSHTLSSTIEKILWKKRQSNLSQKLENRPNLEQLEQRGILPYHISSGYTSSSNSNRSSSVEQQTSSSPSSTSSSNSVSDNTPLHQDFSYIYDQEQALSGIGLGREEKERKKRHIENFLVRRPSKKDLVEMLRKGNSMALHSNLSQVDNEPTLIYDVSGTTSNDLSHASPTTFPSFDPMCILLEPHVLQIHNQLENLQSVTDTESSDDSNNNSESEDEEKGSTSQ
ncbi:hypothetical protein C9374_008063 [Naegleria lovaniensis]|uniref:Uncharacterized protein n=1 Tax=Naegleria lovaniensis TaxID=51637 RepID=A0AA88KBL6_NAELO|nr:uncharacterized protein C9374_012762 [Naegleria lovaniensis]XP_044546177.1 uncharacterized protein C9374_008063 [Naegleria lovaniensis]KAG2373160.1 hypothetical protein C9374_012762 [Naegleria lovaniensis]KAG2378915.1 hypothetical protein C9374_008063 [Naegleria lovaniensis]